MDALIYTVMSGAERSLREQQVRANNLANADTPGFRADKSFATAMRTPGYGYDARHMSELSANGVSERAGPIRQTGRELDVAITGEGYLAVRHEGGEVLLDDGAQEVLCHRRECRLEHAGHHAVHLIGGGAGVVCELAQLLVGRHSGQFVQPRLNVILAAAAARTGAGRPGNTVQIGCSLFNMAPYLRPGRAAAGAENVQGFVGGWVLHGVLG